MFKEKEKRMLSFMFVTYILRKLEPGTLAAVVVVHVHVVLKLAEHTEITKM